MKVAKLLVKDEENRFEVLPDAMVIEILNKLVHAKHLLRCQSVCKRFGSLVFQIETIRIPRPSRYPIHLKKFVAIRSLRMDMDNASPHLEHFPALFVKYKAVFRAARLDVLVFVIAFLGHPSQNVAAIFDEDYDECVFKLVNGCVDFSLNMHDFARILVPDLPLLRQLLIETSHGKFYMGRDEIAELRTTANNSNSPSSETAFVAKILQDRLELPACGRVMPHAYIAVVRPEGEVIVMDRDLGLMLGSFGDGYEDHTHEVNVGKIIDEVVNVVRKKIASDRNGDLITMHDLILPKNLLD